MACESAAKGIRSRERKISALGHYGIGRKMARLTYLGHSSFIIDFGTVTVLTDPWLDPKPRELNRLVPPALTSAQIKKADAILVSHWAPDHADNYDITTIVGRTFASVVAPAEALANITVPQRNKLVATVGDRFHHYGLDVEVMPVRSQTEDAVGYIAEADGKRVYFSGDTYDFYDLATVAADVGIIPIGGAMTMDVLGAVSAAKKMRVKRVVPCHYGTFARIKADPHYWAKRVVKEGAKAVPVVLSVGQALDF